MFPLASLLEVAGRLLDKAIPDPAARAAAKLELARQQQDGELKEMQIALSAIIADAQSADPWTSRARPTFLYVVYILLLWSLPMGVLAMFAPEAGQAFVSGFAGWLNAIPESILQLFGVVMTGYIAGRSWEKVRGVAK